jgi:hypothetical protein
MWMDLANATYLVARRALRCIRQSGPRIRCGHPPATTDADDASRDTEAAAPAVARPSIGVDAAIALHDRSTSTTSGGVFEISHRTPAHIAAHLPSAGRRVDGAKIRAILEEWSSGSSSANSSAWRSRRRST